MHIYRRFVLVSIRISALMVVLVENSETRTPTVPQLPDIQIRLSWL